MEQIERILEEAAAYGLREEVKQMAEDIKKTLKQYEFLFPDMQFSDEVIYQEAFNTCVNAPDYFDMYNTNFDSDE